MPQPIDKIAGEILVEMEKTIHDRVYVAILDGEKVLYASTALDQYLPLLKTFSSSDSRQMKVFSYAYPFPKLKMPVFKVTAEILVALFTKKGDHRELLSFIKKMGKHVNDLKIASEMTTTKPSPTESKGQILPRLIKPVSTLGLSESEALILRLCDGNHSIEEIRAKTEVLHKNIVDILKQYEGKKWLEYDYKGDVDFTPQILKKLSRNSVALGVISRKAYTVYELCDGNNTIQDIAEKLDKSKAEINKTIDKLKKGKIIKMKVVIPKDEIFEQDLKLGSIKEESEVIKEEIVVKRAYDYIGGNIRLKVVIENNSQDSIQNVTILVTVKEQFQLDSPVHKLTILEQNESSGVDFILTPLKCGKSKIYGIATTVIVVNRFLFRSSI